ncbi:hypothetical protein SKAU_G00218610 [Synaphobranchus kaupii]|uniref:Uncharacterized protein n=1 Tax=Synaphobranchus kaupii TaxID=118154 RepID=A0A9Q1FA75_SYNKA|nr:hypothetical protein SKAU_G00218610 [Synaphobranchus kaupii]
MLKHKRTPVPSSSQSFAVGCSHASRQPSSAGPLSALHPCPPQPPHPPRPPASLTTLTPCSRLAAASSRSNPALCLCACAERLKAWCKCVRLQEEPFPVERSNSLHETPRRSQIKFGKSV